MNDGEMIKVTILSDYDEQTSNYFNDIDIDYLRMKSISVLQRLHKTSTCNGVS